MLTHHCSGGRALVFMMFMATIRLLNMRTRRGVHEAVVSSCDYCLTMMTFISLSQAWLFEFRALFGHRLIFLSSSSDCPWSLTLTITLLYFASTLKFPSVQVDLSNLEAEVQDRQGLCSIVFGMFWKSLVQSWVRLVSLLMIILCSKVICHNWNFIPGTLGAILPVILNR